MSLLQIMEGTYSSEVCCSLIGRSIECDLRTQLINYRIKPTLNPIHLMKSVSFYSSRLLILNTLMRKFGSRNLTVNLTVNHLRCSTERRLKKISTTPHRTSLFNLPAITQTWNMVTMSLITVSPTSELTFSSLKDLLSIMNAFEADPEHASTTMSIVLSDDEYNAGEDNQESQEKERITVACESLRPIIEAIALHGRLKFFHWTDDVMFYSHVIWLKGFWEMTLRVIWSSWMLMA